MGYRITRFFIHLLLRLTANIQVCGIEHVPTSGAFIVASNHLGRMDVPLVFHLLDREDIILLVAEKYRSSALIRWLARQFDAIFIDRFNADFNSLRAALVRLRKGGVLVLAPEGTRSQSGTLIEARTGGSFLAQKSSTLTIPVALTGTEDKVVKAHLGRLQRLNITITIGAPVAPPDNNGHNRDVVLRQHTDEVMCQIAAMLPPQYRGVYSEHPRLQQILGGRKDPPATDN